MLRRIFYRQFGKEKFKRLEIFDLRRTERRRRGIYREEEKFVPEIPKNGFNEAYANKCLFYIF